MTELTEDPKGVPYLFLAKRDELASALSAIPDEALLIAWSAYGGRKTWRTVNGLRKQILAQLERRPERVVTPVPLSVAAKRMGYHVNTLRQWIKKGELETTRLRDGTLAVELPGERLERWHIIPARLRLDPRLAAEPLTRPLNLGGVFS